MLRPNDHVLDYVDSYLHDVLDDVDAEYVQRHAEGCRICKVALEEARKRQAALETVPASEASGQLIHATLTKIDSYERSRRRTRKIFGWGVALPAAACIAILSSVHTYYMNLAVTPYSLELLGQTTLLAGTNGSLRIRLINHQTGTPIPGVPVDIDLQDNRSNRNVHLASFTTNAEGTGQPRFELPDWADGDYELQVVARPASGSEVLKESVHLKRSWKVMLTSDKPVYQPGQTIHVRSLALRQIDLKPVAGQTTTFSVSDPKRNVIFKHADPTSKFGIASIDCPLASEIMEGTYTIACQLGDTTSQITVEVKKYVLPKFKIDVTLDQPYYQPGQKVKGQVHAEYFFGKPVVNARADIKLFTTDVHASVSRELRARTDGGGNAQFEMVLPDSLVGTEQNSGDAQISLNVKVLDTAGQEQTRRIARTVTTNPIHLEVIPETVPLMQHQLNTIFVYASYADGRPARARVSISSSDKELVTNSLGVASFEIEPDREQLSLTLHATDAEGRSGRQHVDLRSRHVAGDFIIRMDKAVYRAGETVQLLALGAAAEPIFIDLLKDGQTILTQTIDMSKRRGTIQVDLPPDLFGTLELCAYRFDATGLAVRKTRALYVHPVRELEVKTALDRSEYRPGRTAKVQLALSDNKGNPVAGALSLAAVDEAVYSVLDQRPGLEGAFYTLDQDLLRPIYAIYAWSPDLRNSTSPADRNLLEQALFARTLREGGREAVLNQLLPFLENNERTFEVLKRPDWEQLADERISPATKSMLRFGNAPHTLSDASFAIKASQLEARKQAGLEAVKFGWGLFIFLCLIAGLIVLFSFIRTLVELIVVFLIVVVLIGLILPATQKVREASNRMSALNSLRQIDLAVEAFQDTHGALPSNSKWIDAYRRMDHIVEARVRQWFPETLIWRPEVITDDKGRASIDIDLADSITTWRLTASAVSADGRLGATQAPIRVFQPFFVDLNLPVSLTRGDEAAIPVVVYNYLDKPQTVELSFENATWFERLDEVGKRLNLKPNEVRSTSYRLRARQVGNFELQVMARGSGVADAIKKQIEVVPDGRRVEQVFNGTLQNRAQIALSVPDQAIDGSARVILKIYPSTFSQLVEGLDAIFQMPYGCFEQTSSTTYPNVLALDYLRRTNKNAPAVEAKARQYIHLGYQRLLGFEVAGGGFDWFGRPPANRTLTAYGLMEFQDMAKVHDVDPNLIARTRQWLLSQRNPDGSWTPEAHGFHGDPAQQARRAELARVAATAYIAWAVFDSLSIAGEERVTRDYLLAHDPATIGDPYVLALVANALLGMEMRWLQVGQATRDNREAEPYLAHLNSLKRTLTDGKLIWWEQPADARTSFYGSGASGSIETTALAALALLKAGYEPGTARAALSWLAAQKDAHGTWHSTQATVLALKALLAGTGKPLGGDAERRIEISWGEGSQSLVIPTDQAEVMQQLDLTQQLGHGSQRLTIAEPTGTAAGYQVTLRYHVPGNKTPERQEPLSIDIAYDRTELAVGGAVTATATIVNRMAQAAPMVILDLPIPPGFAVDADDLAGLASKAIIAKYQLNPRSAVVYLRNLEPGEPLILRYHLTATMPVKVTVPGARAYEYYDTDKQGFSKPAKLTVSGLKE